MRRAAEGGLSVSAGTDQAEAIVVAVAQHLRIAELFPLGSDDDLVRIDTALRQPQQLVDLLAGAFVNVSLEVLCLGRRPAVEVLHGTGQCILQSQQFLALDGAGAQIPVWSPLRLIGRSHSNMLAYELPEGLVVVSTRDELNVIGRWLGLEAQGGKCFFQAFTAGGWHLLEQVVAHLGCCAPPDQFMGELGLIIEALKALGAWCLCSKQHKPFQAALLVVFTEYQQAAEDIGVVELDLLDLQLGSRLSRGVAFDLLDDCEIFRLDMRLHPRRISQRSDLLAGQVAHQLLMVFRGECPALVLTKGRAQIQFIDQLRHISVGQQRMARVHERIVQMQGRQSLEVRFGICITGMQTIESQAQQRTFGRIEFAGNRQTTLQGDRDPRRLQVVAQIRR